MLTIFIRAIIFYLTMVVTLRALGKHQLGQFQPYEFALAIMIADLLAAPMSDVSTPLLHGVLPIAALFVTHSVITFCCLKSDKLRSIISGKPSVVVSRGVIHPGELERLCLSVSDLLEGMREAGILDPAEVGTAIVEADGQITAFPHVAKRPVNVEDMQLDPGYEGLPLVLIQSGNVQHNNLGHAGKDEPWLTELLGHYNLTARDVLLASLDTQGRLHVQDMRGGILSIEAIKPEEVAW